MKKDPHGAVYVHVCCDRRLEGASHPQMTQVYGRAAVWLGGCTAAKSCPHLFASLWCYAMELHV